MAVPPRPSLPLVHTSQQVRMLMPCFSADPNLLIHAIEHCIVDYQDSALLLSVGYVPAPAGEAIPPRRGVQCPSATSQAILASPTTLRGRSATASSAGVQCIVGGRVCAVSLSR